MFTGIITDVGTIIAANDRGDLNIRIATGFVTDAIAIGASIACSGVCLTVVEKGADWFAVDVSAETRTCTAAGQWQPGRRLNLERALRVGDEIGGHIVTGHVDGVGSVVSLAPSGASKVIDIAVPQALRRFVAAKGSITIDGVSLTVNAVADCADGTRFSLNIIPHTASATTLGTLGEGDEVNIEIDVLARYLARMEDLRST